MEAVRYIHNSDIVHRNLNPKNMLFRTPAEDADVIITDFSLSLDMKKDIFEEKYHLLEEIMEICGTPGYMAPEILKESM
jgi:serine/threonine protein kinase